MSFSSETKSELCLLRTGKKELAVAECYGILLYGSGKSVWMMIRHWPHVTLSLTRFMNIALIIMLCAEIIRLVLIREPLERAGNSACHLTARLCRTAAAAVSPRLFPGF